MRKWATRGRSASSLANRQSAVGNRQSAFTLIELLVVISIMAVLAGILLPAISAVRSAAKTASTKSLIERVGIALNQYEKDMGTLPPDFVGSGAMSLIAFPGSGAPSLPALPPEAVYYFLANPYLSNAHPYLSALRGNETTDYNRNNLPELSDAWGRPILYNRGRFPSDTANNFNYAGAPPNGSRANPNTYEASDAKPWHNKESFDLYSDGPDATTGGWNGESGRLKPVDPGINLGQFCEKSMKAYGYTGTEASGPSCGDESDDVCNWK